MNGPFDILIIGDDEPALCAAACAAKAGSRVGVLRKNATRRKSFTASTPAIPNFVWRRLELQDYDLALNPVSTRVTLLHGAKEISTFDNDRQTADWLAGKEIKDHHIWSDFTDEVASLAHDNFVADLQFSTKKKLRNGLAKLLSDPYALDRAARMTGASETLLDDYLTDGSLKAHLSAHALSPSGFGPREQGSAAALINFLDETAWPVRPDKNSQSIRTILEKICQTEGVSFLAGRITEVTTASNKHIALSIGADESVKTRIIFFATPETARAYGVDQNLSSPMVDAPGHANFSVKFKLAEFIDPPAGDRDGIFQIVDSATELQEARDSAVKGQFPKKLPVEFEYTRNGEIIARSSFLPGAFFEDGEWRGWTGQDRQAAVTLIKERLTSRMPGLAAQIRRTETEVVTPYLGETPFAGCDQIIVQSRPHNTISAAVKLIDEVIGRDE
ncbi:hypothetical protein [Hyphococcus sp. DH-69]|uniref:hypothetical protein n=1 Tax=Hyphococcus formosus TaxID=3143534 RepID=UPI00398A68B6